MYRLRLGVTALMVALLAGGWLMGDDPKKDDKDAPVPIKGSLPKNWKKLGLTDDQVQKVYKIRASYQTKIADLDRKKKALLQEEKEESEKILTDAQKARLKEILLGEAPKEKTTDKDKAPAKDKAKDK